jgi:hypothetical protein
MNGDTPSDSEERSDFNPPQSLREVADLQMRTYENRVRERLVARDPTPNPEEARRLEKEIEKLVQIYAQGRILLRGVPSARLHRDYGQRKMRSTQESEISHERE